MQVERLQVMDLCRVGVVKPVTNISQHRGWRKSLGANFWPRRAEHLQTTLKRRIGPQFHVLYNIAVFYSLQSTFSEMYPIQASRRIDTTARKVCATLMYEGCRWGCLRITCRNETVEEYNTVRISRNPQSMNYLWTNKAGDCVIQSTLQTAR